MEDKLLIELVKIAKAKGRIRNYADVAAIIGMKLKSFYCWIEGGYKLGYSNKQKVWMLMQELGVKA